jgi:uncharacterized protein (DUF2147 family)
MQKIFFIFIASFFICQTIAAQSKEDWIIGVWTTGSGSGRVKIEKIGSKYYGKVIWLKEPIDAKTGKPKLDVNNPDNALKSTPRLGLRIMKDFVSDGDGVFSGGNIYDPEKGKTYCGKITVKDQNTLTMRGHVCGFKLLGKSDTWKRYTGN